MRHACCKTLVGAKGFPPTFRFHAMMEGDRLTSPEMTQYLPRLKVSQVGTIDPQFITPTLDDPRSEDGLIACRLGFCCAGLSAIDLLMANMTSSGRPINYHVTRNGAARGLTEQDMRDPRGVPGSCRRRSLENLAWTVMEKWI